MIKLTKRFEVKKYLFRFTKVYVVLCGRGITGKWSIENRDWLYGLTFTWEFFIWRWRCSFSDMSHWWNIFTYSPLNKERIYFLYYRWFIRHHIVIFQNITNNAGTPPTSHKTIPSIPTPPKRSKHPLGFLGGIGCVGRGRLGNVGGVYGMYMHSFVYAEWGGGVRYRLDEW